MAVPSDYDTDPERYRLGMRVSGAYAAGNLYAWVVVILQTLDTRVVLDVGCADGVLHRALGPAGPRLIGLDVAATLLRHHPPPSCAATLTGCRSSTARSTPSPS